jgi:hypothetical protein
VGGTAPGRDVPSITLKVVDRGWNDLMRIMRETARHPGDLQVGVFTDLEGGGDVRTKDGLTNADLAAIHEFGTSDGHIPERSFMRSTFAMYKRKYLELLKDKLIQVVTGRMSSVLALKSLGDVMVTDMKARVVVGDIEPYNADSTVAFKQRMGYLVSGAVTPLIATGRMISALTRRLVSSR